MGISAAVQSPAGGMFDAAHTDLGNKPLSGSLQSLCLLARLHHIAANPGLLAYALEPERLQRRTQHRVAAGGQARESQGPKPKQHRGC